MTSDTANVPQLKLGAGAPGSAAALRERIARISTANALRLTVLAVALVQLGILIVQSAYIYSHGQLSQDFYIFEQARYLIGHGVLDPYSTARGFHYWQNHGEFIMWPLAWISRVTWNSGFILLLIQALATAGSTYVGVTWLISRWERQDRQWTAPLVLTVLGCLTVMLINPWTYLSDSFDFHLQALDTLLVIVAARAIDERRLRLLGISVLLMLGTGDVAGTYVCALGISALIVARMRRERLRVGLVLIAVGIVWTLLLSALKANQGYSLGQFYGYLTTTSGTTVANEPSLLDVAKGAVLHPSRTISALGHSASNIWANLAAPGLFGVLSPWALPISAVTVASYALIDHGMGTPWSRPSFQSLPTYALITVGTGFVVMTALAHRDRRWRIVGVVIGVLALGQSVAWAAVMLPKIPAEWTNVTPAGHTALSRARTLIPIHAEVVAQQGVVGDFADHRYVYFSEGVDRKTETFPVQAPVIYFVGAIYQADETPVNQNFPFVTEAAELPGAQVLEASQVTGVWVIRWRPQAGTKVVHFTSRTSFPAWVLPTNVGSIVKRTASVRSWYEHADGKKAGYVSYGDQFHLVSGSYLATVRASAAGPLSIQVWDDTTGRLLASRVLRSRSARTVRIPIRLTKTEAVEHYSGSSLFRYKRIAPPAGDIVEIRVYAPRGTPSNVYRIGLADTSG